MNTELIKAVIRQLGGKEALEDVYNHGADGGFSGFTYYSETCAFYKENKKVILELIMDMAIGLSEDAIEMIGKFKCLSNMNLAFYDIAKALDNKGDNDTITQVQNAMAWFALEEVAREMVENTDETYS